jgi:hypothetical protein
MYYCIEKPTLTMPPPTPPCSTRRGRPVVHVLHDFIPGTVQGRRRRAPGLLCLRHARRHGLLLHHRLVLVRLFQ